MTWFFPGVVGLTLCMAAPSSRGQEQAARGSVSDLKRIPDKLVVLTFDDCNKSDRGFVADEIRKHGFGATFYVTEGLGFLHNKKHYVTWKEIVELHEMGFEIGNHTKTHPHMPRLSKEAMKEELLHIEKRCAEHGIPKPVTFCYPGFGNNLACVEVLMGLGYQFARRGVGPEFRDGGRGARGPVTPVRTGSSRTWCGRWSKLVMARSPCSAITVCQRWIILGSVVNRMNSGSTCAT